MSESIVRPSINEEFTTGLTNQATRPDDECRRVTSPWNASGRSKDLRLAASDLSVDRTHKFSGSASLTGETTVRTVSPSAGYPGTYFVEVPQIYSTSTVVGSYTSNGVVYSTTFEITSATQAVRTTSEALPPAYTQINPSISEAYTTTISDVPVVVNPPYTTVYTQIPSASSLSAPTVITTVQPDLPNNEQGTVIVGVPAIRWVTTTIRWTGSTLITAPVTSSYPPTSTEPGTVVVQTPPPVVSTTQAYTGASSIPSLITATTLIGSGSDAWTVVLQTPQSYVTTTQLYTGQSSISAAITATTIPPGSDGSPGTVIIQTPPGYQPPVYRTTTQLYTGFSPISDPITTTFEPTGTNVGLVLIQTPPGWVTSTRAYSGSSPITAPITATTIWPAGGSQGVVWIETPTGFAQPSSSVGSALPSSSAAGIPEPPSSSLPSALSTTGQSTPASVPLYTSAPSPSVLPACPPLACGAIARNSTSCENSYGNQYNVTCGIRLWGTIAKRATVSNSEECLIQCDQTPGCVAINYYSQSSSQTQNCEMLSEVDYETSEPGTAGAERPADVEEINSVPPTSTIGSTPAPQLATTTSTRLYTGASSISDSITATTIAASGSNPAIVVIETPGPPPSPGYQTSFRPYTGASSISAATTVSTILPSGQISGVYIVETPTGFAAPSSSPQESYITSTRPWTSPSPIAQATTVSTILPTGTLPGVYIVETPSSALLSSSLGISSSAAISLSLSASLSSTAISPSFSSSSSSAEVPLTLTNAFSETYVTVTRPWTGTSPISSATIVSTIRPTNGLAGTYILETPSAGLPGYVTSTRGAYTGADQITAATTVSTVLPSQGPFGPVSGTYIVETQLLASSTTSEIGSYVTLTTAYTGSSSLTAPLTSTIAQPSNGSPGTVQIQTPVRYVTTTRAYSGSSPITMATTVTTIQGSGSDPNTIVVETPSPSGASSCASNSNGDTTSPSGDVYTVRCQTDTDGSSLGFRQATTGFNDCFAFCDSTSGCLAFTFVGSGLIIGDGPGECQLKGAAGADADPVFTSFNANAVSALRSRAVLPPGPSYYVTTTRPYTGASQITQPITASSSPPSGSNPGLIVIETPTSSSGVEYYVTTTRPYTGASFLTQPITAESIPPASGNPGTIIVETGGSQNYYVTTTRLYTGLSSISGQITATSIPPANGSPGLIIVETPPPGYVTATSYGQFAGTTTLTSIPYSGSISGTIVLGIPETSQANYYITSTTYGSYAGTTILTSVAPSATQPGYIWVGIPETQTMTTPSPSPLGYETQTTYGPYSQPTTLTSSPPSNTQSGLILVGLPYTRCFVDFLRLAQHAFKLVVADTAFYELISSRDLFDFIQSCSVDFLLPKLFGSANIFVYIQHCSIDFLRAPKHDICKLLIVCSTIFKLVFLDSFLGLCDSYNLWQLRGHNNSRKSSSSRHGFWHNLDRSGVDRDYCNYRGALDSDNDNHHIDPWNSFLHYVWPISGNYDTLYDTILRDRFRDDNNRRSYHGNNHYDHDNSYARHSDLNDLWQLPSYNYDHYNFVFGYRKRNSRSKKNPEPYNHYPRHNHLDDLGKLPINDDDYHNSMDWNAERYRHCRRTIYDHNHDLLHCYDSHNPNNRYHAYHANDAHDSYNAHYGYDSYHSHDAYDIDHGDDIDYRNNANRNRVNPPYQAATTCPVADDSIIASPNNLPYRIRCGWDTTGNAYGSYQQTCASCTYVDCMSYCDAGAACLGFTWLGQAGVSTNGQGTGNCYFKQNVAQGQSVAFDNQGGLAANKVSVIKACAGQAAVGSGGAAAANTQYTTVTYAYQPTASTETTIRTSTTIAPSGTYQGTVILATPVATAPCVAEGYLSLFNNLNRVNLQNGSSSLIATVNSGTNAINSLGYNPLDFYLYGNSRETANANVAGPQRFMRIGFNGNTQFLFNLPTYRSFYVGDIDSNGQYWSASQDPTWQWIQVNLNPSLPAYQQIVDSGNSTLPAGARVQDWAFVIGGGPYLYGVAITYEGLTSLNRFDLTTKTWTAVGSFGYTVTVNPTTEKRWNALYSGTGNGDLFGLEGFSGQLWKFNVNTLTASFVIQGPVGSSEADGARCLNAPI
ncbi:hypothetical protein PRZ48_008517 [Zasmidium cellare]|uniref:Apple domain-containing protein n=1 Tax=Zasmidium cellare TaxID=395010 RepID=A0ABR0EGJ4_ZASCE|nr:hypothetical protein PRZ48_008517 [Zasmidium cellare]